MHSKKAFRAILLASVLGFGSVPAQAALSSTFDLTDQWSVSPAASGGAGDPNAATPCVMANQYENGFKIRFTGGQGQVFMMAIDFRQNIFTKGQGYPTNIAINGQPVAQTDGRAFSGSTLLFDVRDLDGFGAALKQGQNMNLNVQGNVLNFSLSQIQPALARMEACGTAAPAPKAAQPVEAKAQPQTVVPARVNPVKAEPEAPAVDQVAEAEPDTEATKAREVYIRRRVKPLEADSQDEAKAQELASIESAAGDEAAAEDMSAGKYPEPIDLFRDQDAPSKAVSITSRAPKAETPKAKIQADGPVLVSRRDQALSMEAKMDSRPQEMALFEKGAPAQPDVAPKQAAVAAVAVAAAPSTPPAPLAPATVAKAEIQETRAPVKKPHVSIVDMPKMAMKAIAQKFAPKDEAPQVAAQVSKESGEDFLQQSSQEAQKTAAVAEPEIVEVAAQDAVQKTPMPYSPIKRQKPYEPIKADVAQPEEKKAEIAAADTEDNAAKEDVLSAGVKVQEPAKVTVVSEKNLAPAWMPPQDIKARKKAEVPASQDVLDAQAEAVIPISTVRSKDVFVSRADEEQAQNIEKLAQALAADIIKAKEAQDEQTAQAQPLTETQPLEPIISKAEPQGQPMGVPAQQPMRAAQQNWSAKEGEDVKIVLARWAERAGTDLVWEADRGGKLSKDINSSGSFEDAVQALLAQNGEALGLDGSFAGQEPAMTAASQSQQGAPLSLISAPQDIEPAAGGQQGMDAGSLRPFLQQIAQKEGVKLMWNAQRDFAMKSPINGSASFEETLRSSLEQFSNDPVRPVGQLNINPENGERTLVIESERSL